MIAKRKRRRRQRAVSRSAGEASGARPVGGRPALVGPTPQTAAKLKRDLIAHLRDKERLIPEHARAAEDIRRIWQAFSRILGPSATNPATLATGRQAGGGQMQIDWLTEREEAIWRERYRPWASEMAAQPCGGTIRVTKFQIVFEIVVDNRSLRQTEGAYRMRHGSAFDIIRAALHRYAEIAGWIEESISNSG